MKMRKKIKWHNRKKCKKCGKMYSFGGHYLFFGLIKKKTWNIPRCICNKTVINTKREKVEFETDKKSGYTTVSVKPIEQSEKDSQGGICG
jgi:hypothetical protein